MEQITADGWTADWLVGWLASVGVTYRDRDIKLSWTDEPVPRAVFHMDSLDRLDSIMPTIEEIQGLAIARHREGLLEFPRNPTRDSYVERAEVARRRADLTLGATTSDIGLHAGDELPHSPFDASVPRGITIAERLVSAASGISAGVAPSFGGSGRTSNQNGLGFDLRRLGARSVRGKGLWTDPVAETLAFFGVLMLSQSGSATRGWKSGSIFRTGAFSWPSWERPLDWAGIDAMIDHFNGHTSDFDHMAGRVFHSIAYRPTGSADTTRGYDGVAAAVD